MLIGRPDDETGDAKKSYSGEGTIPEHVSRTVGEVGTAH